MVAWVWPAVQVGVAALGMISSYLGMKKSADRAKTAGTKEARAETAVTTERLRQLEIEEKTVMGATRAGYAGGGVKADQGSALQVLAEQAREFAFEKQITARVGATKAASALQRGRDVGNAVRYQSYSNLAQGASNIFSIINQAGARSKGVK